MIVTMVCLGHINVYTVFVEMYTNIEKNIWSLLFCIYVSYIAYCLLKSYYF